MKGIRRFNRKRVLFINIIWIIIGVYVAFNYVRVSVIKGEHYRKEALKQWTKAHGSQNPRGEILDRFGARVAFSVPRYRVWINSELYEKIEDKSVRDEFLEKICKILNLEEKEVLDSMKKRKRTLLSKYINEDKKGEIIELKGSNCLEISDVNKRFYPDGVLYNHIVGFTDIDDLGLSGVELTYNEKLEGSPSLTVKKVDRRNNDLPFSERQTFGGLGNADIVLTVSDKIQRIAFEECQKALIENKAKSVSVLVMDPKTGDILAMTDSNTYDINDPLKPKDEDQAKKWEEATDEEVAADRNQNWRSLNINNIFEPGSTFKSITLAASLEEGAVDDSTNLYCNGVLTDIPGVKIRCVRWQNPHGALDITNAYSESCNVAFVQIGRLLNKHRFLKYIKAFGFGEKTGIQLNGEATGLIPSTESEMTPVRLATATFGHGVASTPLQIANAISAIVNGGDLLVPRIVKEIRYKNGDIERVPVQIKRKVISKFTSDKMREIMEYAVQHGNKQAMVKGYRVGGKSGTTTKLENGKYLNDKFIASFVGVAPIDDPRILVMVVVDEPGNGVSFGGAVCGPVSANIMRKALPLLGIYPSADDISITDETVMVPDVTGLSLEEASSKLLDSSLKYYIEEELMDYNYEVISQDPMPNTYVNKGSIIDLKLKKLKKEELIPDFIGMTIENAQKLCVKLGIKHQIEGTGKCVKQSIDPGAKISEDEIIKLYFE